MLIWTSLKVRLGPLCIHTADLNPALYHLISSAHPIGKYLKGCFPYSANGPATHHHPILLFMLRLCQKSCHLYLSCNNTVCKLKRDIDPALHFSETSNSTS